MDVDQVVAAGAMLAELDKEQLRARVRELDANLLAKRAALAGAEAQLKKNTIEAESRRTWRSRAATSNAPSR